MASSASSLTKCPECHKDYDKPRILPCTHTLCSRCIEKSITAARANSHGSPPDTFECPICKDKIRLSQKGTVEGYMPNQFADALTSLGERSPKEPGCLGDVPAVCSQHSKPYVDFCMQCHANKCEMCEKSCINQNHTLFDIHEQAEKGRTNISQFLQGSLKQLRQASVTITTSQKISEASTPAYKEIIAKLERRRDMFMDMMTDICEELIQELWDNSRKKEKMIAEMELHLENMQDTTDYAAQLLDMGRTADIAQQHRVLTQKLKAITNADFQPIASESIQIVYDDDIDIADELRAMFGGVYIKKSATTIPPEPSRYSVAMTDVPPTLVGSIKVPLHVNGISGAPATKANGGGDVYIATKGIRLNALTSLFVKDQSKATGISTPATPEFHVLDYDTGQEVRTLTVRKTSDGVRKEVFDTGGDELRSFATKQRFLDVTHMSNGFIAATNDNKKKLCIFTPNGIIARESHISKCKGPWGIACAEDDILIVSDCDARRITIHDTNGKIMRVIDKSSDGTNYFSFPCFVAARGQVLVVSDVAKHRILAFTVEGEFLWQYGKKGSDKYQLYRPEGVCIDSLGNVYVAENGNSRISVINGDGQFIKYLLTENDGLQNPFSMSLTEDNRLFILERLITKPAKPMCIKQYLLS